MERICPGSLPFSNICLDLLGPIDVKGVVNKRAGMKVWPILFVCQAMGALHIEVMTDYCTQALLLQWQKFVSIRGMPRKVVCDQGKQLTSSKKVAAFPAKETP